MADRDRPRLALGVFLRYALGSGVAVVLTAAMVHMGRLVNAADAALIYLLWILVVAAWAGFGPAVVASITATLLYNFDFLPPVGTLTIADPANWVALLAFLITASVTSRLVTEARKQSAVATARAAESMRLYEFGRQLLTVTRPTEGLGQLVQAVRHVLEAQDGWLVRWREGGFSTEDGTTLPDALQEPLSVLESCRSDPTSAGRTALTVQTADAWFLIIPLPGKVFRGLLMAYEEDGHIPNNTILAALKSLVALALERLDLLDESLQAEVLRKSEAVKSAILSSVSHDLRTPLSALQIAATALQEESIWRDRHARQELLGTIDESVRRLNSAVDNLLHMSRIEAGRLVLDLRPCLVVELIQAAIERIGPKQVGRRIRVELYPGVPAVICDRSLLTIALANLIDNAAKYSPPESTIEVVARKAEAGAAQIWIRDRGVGIASHELEHVFRPFQRGTLSLRRASSPSGIGLGLTIARALVEAHGGSLVLLPRAGGGTDAVLQLPAPPEDPRSEEG